MLPLFSSTQVNPMIRVGLGLAITFVVWSTVPVTPELLGLGPMTAAVFAQVFIGFVVGFVAGFLGVCGHSVRRRGHGSASRVFSIVNVINPLTSQNVSVLGEFQLALASMIYLVANAHHFLFQGLAGSFTLLPLPYVSINSSLETSVMGFFAQSFYMVFQIAGPIGIALFLTNVGLAPMARVAPQVNIFAVGFPIQIMIGLTMMIISLPLLEVVLPQVFEQTPRELDAVLRAMRVPG